MKKILIRADDLGYSEAVNYGIEKSIKDGLIKSVGMMPNMYAASHGFNLIKNYDICLGQHTNICIGKPVCDPKLVPSLVDENGEFKSSSYYRNSKQEVVVLEEVIMEIEAQYKRFVQLTGYEPKYLDGHAINSKNFFKGLEIVAKKFNLKYSGFTLNNKPMLVGKTNVYIHIAHSIDQKSIEPLIEAIEQGHDGDCDMVITHPGYIDAYILENSSVNIPRVYEVEMLCSETAKQCLNRKDIKLVTYNDL
ncbi:MULTISPECIES: ChbG/HpnK family deacetylase [Clostridium]|uniref:ChbG/HpnK family deacetylase n=1 Tax=Clostridium TaxID=1485 RepID=UPI00082644F6|nr:MULTISPECIES: ChbG/HpnK family deacetylase [Clostridium]PJI09086.1 ChbG/HpnK family deacetylase [Clostridium sp. CT7]